MHNLRNGSKGGFEPGLTRLQVRHSTTELPTSICTICTALQLYAATHRRYPNRAVLRLVWPSILLQSARGRVATAAAKERHVRKTG